MTSQIKGYNPVSEKALKNVNKVKLIEEVVLRLIDNHENYDEVDKRYLRTARTDLEKGFSTLNKAILRPSRLNLDINKDASELLSILNEILEEKNG